MNIPTFASSYHLGNGRRSKLAQFGSYCCGSASTTKYSFSAPNKLFSKIEIKIILQQMNCDISLSWQINKQNNKKHKMLLSLAVYWNALVERMKQMRVMKLKLCKRWHSDGINLMKLSYRSLCSLAQSLVSGQWSVYSLEIRIVHSIFINETTLTHDVLLSCTLCLWNVFTVVSWHKWFFVVVLVIVERLFDTFCRLWWMCVCVASFFLSKQTSKLRQA